MSILYHCLNLGIYYRHVPWDILECGAKMLPTPPADMFEKHDTIGPLEYCNDAEDAEKKDNCQKQAAWATCVVIPKINAALMDWKKDYCPAGFNTDQKTYVLKNPTVAYGRPADACEKCVKKFDGGAYKESSRA
jgi:hypothetical protein